MARARYLLVLGGHFGDLFLDHMVDHRIEWVWEHDVRAGLARAIPVARPAPVA